MDLARVPYLRLPPSPDPPAHPDPDVLPASEWLGRAPARPGALVLGVPFAGGSISRARCDLSPAEVRRALSRFTVWSSDEETSLERLAVLDAGDVEPEEEAEKTQMRVAEAVAELLRQSPVPLAALGGDNSVTVGLATGARADALITLDAHHDCRDPARGATNGSPVRQLVEEGLPVVQIGIHGFANAEAHARWADRHGVRWFTADTVRELGLEPVVRRSIQLLGDVTRIWVDFDLDVLDRAFAPGAPAALPGGLAPADLQRAAFLFGRDPAVVGMDVVELDPTADVAATTVRAACSVLLAFLAGVAAREPA